MELASWVGVSGGCYGHSQLVWDSHIICMTPGITCCRQETGKYENTHSKCPLGSQHNIHTYLVENEHYSTVMG